MQPIPFPAANVIVKAPEAIRDLIADLPALKGQSEIVSRWQPSLQEINDIVSRGYLTVVILTESSIPPIGVFGSLYLPGDEQMDEGISGAPSEMVIMGRKIAAIRALTEDPRAAMRLYQDVAAFHHAFGHPIAKTPGMTTPERDALRVSLIAEESREFEEAVAAGDIVAIADALMDLLYVTIGACLEYGIPPTCWDEVQRSNMSKLGEDGKPITREDGKTLKGPNFSPPNLREILANAGCLSLNPETPNAN